MTIESTPTAPAPKPRKKHRWLKITGICLLVLVTLFALLPTLLSTGPGRGFVFNQVNNSIPGKLQADDLSLGWFSNASVKGLSLLDPEGKNVATVSYIDTPITVMGAIGGKFSGPIRITITHADINLDTNNLMRSLVKPHPPSTSPSKPFITQNQVTIFLEDVTITAGGARLAVDRESTINATLDTNGGINELTIDLKLHDAAHPDASLYLHAKADAFAAGALRDVKSIKADATIKLHGIELALVQPFIKSLGLNISGVLETPDKDGIAISMNGLDEGKVVGSLNVVDATASGPAFQGDALEKQTIELPLNITWSGSKYDINAEVKSPLMHLAANGTITRDTINALLNGTKADPSKLTLSGEILGPPLARQFPHTLHLAPGTTLASGNANLDGVIEVADKGPHAALTIRTKDVAGMQNGKSITLQPLQLAADLARTSNRLDPRISIKMPADTDTVPGGTTLNLTLQPDAASANKYTINGTYDLASINAQAAQIIDLQGRTFTGGGTLLGSATLDPAGPVSFDIRNTNTNLNAVLQPGTLAVRGKDLTLAIRGTTNPQGIHLDETKITGSNLIIASGTQSTPATNINISTSGTLDTAGKTFMPEQDLLIQQINSATGKIDNAITIAKGGKISYGETPMDIHLTTTYTLDTIASFLKALSPTFAHTLAGNGSTALHITGPLAGPITFDGRTDNPLIVYDTMLPQNFDLSGPIQGTITLSPVMKFTATAIDLKGRQITLGISKSLEMTMNPAGTSISADGISASMDLATWTPTLVAMGKLPAANEMTGAVKIDGGFSYSPTATAAAITATINSFQNLEKNASGQWTPTLAPTDITAKLFANIDLANGSMTITDNSLIQEQDPKTRETNSVALNKGSVLAWLPGKSNNATLSLTYDLARIAALLKPKLPAQLTVMQGKRTIPNATLTGPILAINEKTDDPLKRFSALELTTISPGFDQIVYGGFTIGKGEQPIGLTKSILSLSGSPIPVNSGSLSLGGRVDLNRPTPAYIVDKPVNLLSKIDINDKIAAGQLFFLPFTWAADANNTQVVGITGKIDLTIKDADLPLNSEKLKSAGTLHGTLSITGLNTTFPVLTSLLQSTGPLLKISQTDYGIKNFNIPDIQFALENGRITYSNLVLKAGNTTLTFTGSVGMDTSLDMNVILQEPHIPIAIPIHMTGTTAKPKLDLKLTAGDLLKLNTGGGGGNPLDNLLKPNTPAQPQGAATAPTKPDPVKDAQDLLNMFKKEKTKPAGK